MQLVFILCSPLHAPMCKRFACAPRVIAVLHVQVSASLTLTAEQTFLKTSLLHHSTFLPVNYSCFCFNSDLPFHVTSGADIGFKAVHDAVDGHVLCLSKPYAPVLISLPFSPVSCFSVSFQSSTGHSINTTPGAFELPCANQTQARAFSQAEKIKWAIVTLNKRFLFFLLPVSWLSLVCHYLFHTSEGW